jgi:hypothetical protein
VLLERRGKSRRARAQPNSISITVSDASWFVRARPDPIGSAVQSSSTMHEQ